MTEDLGESAIVSSASERPRRSAGPLLLAAVAILAALAYVAWRYFYYPTTPQYALQRFLDAAKEKDYDAVYELVQVPGPLRALVHNGAELKSLAERFPSAIPDVDKYRFTHTEVNGDHAKIDVAMVLTQGGRRAFDTTPFELTRVDGIWRIDGQWILDEAAKRGLGGLLLGAP